MVIDKGPRQIGKAVIESPFVLAPMAGVNCSSFRLLCRESGAGLVYTQMYHSEFILHKHDSEGIKAIEEFINIQEKERPVAVQLVGSVPESMARAAKLIEPIADIIDINLGCCDDNMIRSGCGAFFARHPDRIPALVSAVIKSVKKPVTAKIRIGFDSQSINGVSVAQLLENLGVSAVAVHGRVATQKYSGKANWEIIGHISKRLKIPVIGNGDARSSRSALEMLERTGCAFVMVGRRAMGDPGFFTRCTNRFYRREEPVPEPRRLFSCFVDYYDKIDRSKSFTELKAHAMWFSKRARLGARSRLEIMRAKDANALLAIFGSSGDSNKPF